MFGPAAIRTEGKGWARCRALGHSDVRTTMNICSHVLPAVQRDAADKMNDLVSAV